ncbi:MAG: metal-dependent transcriptional regulator [Candidatus Hadarchaeota archaeon]
MGTGLSVTENEARYLKLIYRAQCEKFTKVRTTAVAKSLAVRPATVTEVIQNLSEKNLLRHRRYHGVELTREGIAEARKLLRKHRILEVLFTDLLKYDAQNACKEASKLDYHASMELINAICRAYRHPEICPCEKTIFGDAKCEKMVME